MLPKNPDRDSRAPSGATEWSASIDPATLGPWIDRSIEMGLPLGGNSPPRAIVAPHIDPARGARVYGSAYRLLRGHPARRIVILGIGHAGGEIPFAVCDEPIPTPFGSCPIDRDFVRSLCVGLPFDPLSTGSLHREEHSIFHQALFLRRVLDGWDRRSVIPILACFSWEPRTAGRDTAGRSVRIEAFVRRLAGLLDEGTLVIAGVDLAHVRTFRGGGSEFEGMRAETERRDRELLELVGDGDAEGLQAVRDREEDARGICGYPALLTLLRILPATRGVVVDYGQAIFPPDDALVSFAAMVLR